MKKLSIKAISILLSFLMVITGFPFYVFASDGTEDFVVEDTREEVFEIVSSRTANSKVYRLADGSYYLAQYDTDVHYLSENGTWEEIDNTLSVSGDSISTPDAKIKFAKKTTGNGELFALHNGNSKLTLSLNNANKKIAAEIQNSQGSLDESATRLEKMTALDGISASVTYADILTDTDLQYIINGVNIKENILVKARRDSYTYDFTMSLNNLTVSYGEAGELLLKNTANETVYIIPAPVMWDAAGETSDAVSMTLTDLGNGKYTMTIAADSAWINAEDRAFPVTIDPPIYSSTATTGVTDGYLGSSTTATINTSSNTMTIGTDYRVYWRNTNLPTLPEDAYITNASFHAYALDGTAPFSGTAVAYEVTSTWDSTLTRAQTTASTPKGSLASYYTDYLAFHSENYDGIYTISLSMGRMEWFITPLVKKWYADSSTNHGIAIEVLDGFSGTVQIHSSEASVATKRPALCIEYRDMKGLEDYWSYSSQSAGFAGSGAVNQATGILNFSIPTLTTTDSLLPVTPTLVYSSAIDSEFIDDDAQVAMSAATMPKQMKLNLQETIVERSYVDENGETVTYYVLSDGDGTEHAFFSTGVANKYEDEDGLLLKLEHNSAKTIFTLTDSGHNVRTFEAKTGGWFLTSLRDQHGNELAITLDNNTNAPTELKLHPNDIVWDDTEYVTQMRFLYRADGRLAAVWNPAAEEFVVLRYSDSATGTTLSENGTYLRTILRGHGDADQEALKTYARGTDIANASGITIDATADYTYNSAGRLSGVTNNLTQYKVEYTYDSSSRVISVKEYGKGVTDTTYTLGQQIGIIYDTTHTKIRTSGKDDVYDNADDLITVSAFDAEGRTVSAYTTDLNGTEVYGASNGQYVEDNEKAKNNLKYSLQSSLLTSNYILNGGFENEWNRWIYTNAQRNASGSYQHEGYCCGELSISASQSISSVSQDIFLKSGDYYVSLFANVLSMPDGATFELRVANEDRTLATETLPYNENYESNGYAFIGVPITVSAEKEENYTVEIRLYGNVSDEALVFIDNVTLVKADAAGEYSMVHGGHFENIYIADEDFSLWFSESNSPIITASPGVAFLGDSSLAVSSNFNFEDIYQTVYTAADEMKTAYNNGTLRESNQPILYTVSGWGKCAAQSWGYSSQFALWVRVDYYNGTTDSNEYEYFTFDFNKSVVDWQYVSGCFVTDPSKGMVDTIKVYPISHGNPGVAYFDEISLVRDSGNIYSYNEYGYLAAVYSDRQTNIYNYDEDNNLTHIVYSDNTYVEYCYKENTTVVEVEKFHEFTGDFLGFGEDEEDPTRTIVLLGEGGTATELNRTYYSYLASGLMTEIDRMKEDDSSDKISITYTYETGRGSHIYGALKSETNAQRKVTRYFRNENNGRLNAVIYPDENGVCYTYDAMGNITLVSPATLTSSQMSYTPSASDTNVEYAYNSITNRLDTITTDSTTYTFTYDAFGNSEEIKAGASTLASYEYTTSNGKLEQLIYGNGHTVKYIYDHLDRVSEICYNSEENSEFETAYFYHYNTNNQLYKIEDMILGEVIVYNYDHAGRLVKSYTYDAETYQNLTGIAVKYDDQSRITYMSQTIGYDQSDTGMLNAFLDYYYTYDGIGNLETSKFVSSINEGTITYEYDQLNRVTSKIFSAIDTFGGNDLFYNKVSFTYNDDGSYQSELVSQFISEVGISENSTTSTTYKYSYDANGNITKITDANNVVQYRYTYDSLGQLIREDNKAKNKTYVYEYDAAGNILKKRTYAYTTETLGTVQSTVNYTYGNESWGDQLTQFNGVNITYDGIGNPIQIGNAEIDGTDVQLSWNGRELTQYVYREISGMDESQIYYNTNTYSFTYNIDGIRTSKTVDGIVHEYVLNGNQITAEKWKVGSKEYLLIFLYDANGAPIGMKYWTTGNTDFSIYFFEKNLQGDIVAVYNAEGEKIGSYTYDAWGNHTYSTVSGSTSLERRIVTTYNPFRYRGYYYDVETQWYCLQTRYYNPNWGRFISPDKYGVIGVTPMALTDKNLYAYCDNNPITRIDEDGEFWGAITGAVLGAIGGAIEAWQDGENIWAGAAVGATTGALSGLVVDLAVATGGIAGVVIAAAGGAVSSVIEDVANGAINGDMPSLDEVATNALFSAAGNALSMGMALEPDVLSGAKNLKEAFVYAGKNFTNTFLRNSKGVLIKSLKTKLTKFGKEMMSELGSSVVFDATMTYFEECVTRSFGG